MSATIRRLTAADLDAVMRVQAACYPPELNEERALFARRLAAAPETAWLAESAGTACAYLFCYPSRPGRITPLGGDFAPSRSATALYLHDLAVAPAVAGQGLGGRLVATAVATAQRLGLVQASLVAVRDAEKFWQAQGFQRAGELTAEQQALLAGYGPAAVYMQRPLAT